jgi:hypothetical protein
MTTPKLSFDEFAAKYCERQKQTPEGLLEVLRAQKEKFQLIGWALAEAQLMDSSWMGSLTIVPYGPKNTFKDIPKHPFSPRGLASDTSLVIACCLADELPEKAAPWKEPDPPQPKKRKKS